MNTWMEDCINPATIAISQSPARMLWRARCSATTELEQAVSRVRQGPSRPKKCEMRPAAILIKEMARVSQLTGVGPMAAVAGAIAEAVGRDLLAFSPEVIVENGGDIFLKISRKRLVGIYAGESSFTKKIGLEIMARETPLGICTSSGTVGHSLSLGSADAVIVLSPSTALADAAATALGNLVRAADDIPQAIEKARSIEGLRGLVVIVGEKMGVWGKVKLVPLE